MLKSTHTEAYVVLRARLAAMRANAGLSQRELAAKLDVPHSWIAKVESGERRIDLIEFSLFCEACAAPLLLEATAILKNTSAKPKASTKLKSLKGSR